MNNVSTLNDPGNPVVGSFAVVVAYGAFPVATSITSTFTPFIPGSFASCIPSLFTSYHVIPPIYVGNTALIPTFSGSDGAPGLIVDPSLFITVYHVASEFQAWLLIASEPLDTLNPSNVNSTIPAGCNVAPGRSIKNDLLVE